MKQSILVILIVAPVSVLCQSSVYQGAEAYLHYSLNFVDAASFNRSLSHYNLPALNSTQMRAGAGGGVFLRKFYFGGEGGVQFGGSAANDLYRSDFYGGFGMVKGGYQLVRIPSLAVYPVLGLGGGGSAIAIREGAEYSDNDNGATLSPGEDIHSGYMLVDLAVNINFFPGAEGSKGKIVIGFTPGYRFHPLKSSWTYADQKLSDLSEFAPSGFYLQAKLGWLFWDTDEM